MNEPIINIPISVESRNLATGIPLAKTLKEPILTTAGCGTHLRGQHTGIEFAGTNLKGLQIPSPFSLVFSPGLDDNGGSFISQHPACNTSDWGGDESCLGGGLSGLGQVGLIQFSADIDMQFELSKNYSNIVLKCDEFLDNPPIIANLFSSYNGES